MCPMESRLRGEMRNTPRPWLPLRPAGRPALAELEHAPGTKGRIWPLSSSFTLMRCSEVCDRSTGLLKNKKTGRASGRACTRRQWPHVEPAGCTAGPRASMEVDGEAKPAARSGFGGAGPALQCSLVSVRVVLAVQCSYFSALPEGNYHSGLLIHTAYSSNRKP